MNALEQTKTREIIGLHNEIEGYLTKTLESAIRIGELLTEQKTGLPHGQFTPWIEDSLPFTPRTARNYMRLFEHRDQLKTETVSVLGEAYRLLAAPKPTDPLQEAESAERELTGLKQEVEKAKEEWVVLEQDVDADGVNTEEKLELLTTFTAEMGTLQNRAAELRLRTERAAGQLMGAEGTVSSPEQILPPEGCFLQGCADNWRVWIAPSISEGYYYVTSWFIEGEEGGAHAQGTKKAILPHYIPFILESFGIRDNLQWEAYPTDPWEYNMMYWRKEEHMSQFS